MGEKPNDSGGVLDALDRMVSDDAFAAHVHNLPGVYDPEGQIVPSEQDFNLHDSDMAPEAQLAMAQLRRLVRLYGQWRVAAGGGSGAAS
jgi:hypothetical protein